MNGWAGVYNVLLAVCSAVSGWLFSPKVQDLLLQARPLPQVSALFGKCFVSQAAIVHGWSRLHCCLLGAGLACPESTCQVEMQSRLSE